MAPAWFLVLRSCSIKWARGTKPSHQPATPKPKTKNRRRVDQTNHQKSQGNICLESRVLRTVPSTCHPNQMRMSSTNRSTIQTDWPPFTFHSQALWPCGGSRGVIGEWWPWIGLESATRTLYSVLYSVLSMYSVSSERILNKHRRRQGENTETKMSSLWLP